MSTISRIAVTQKITSVDLREEAHSYLSLQCTLCIEHLLIVGFDCSYALFLLWDIFWKAKCDPVNTGLLHNFVQKYQTFLSSQYYWAQFKVVNRKCTNNLWKIVLQPAFFKYVIKEGSENRQKIKINKIGHMDGDKLISEQTVHWQMDEQTNQSFRLHNRKQMLTLHFQFSSWET